VKIFDGTLGQLERSLDVRLVRHNVLSGNVANVDTPGFRAKDVDFAAAMAVVEGKSTGFDTLQVGMSEAGHMDGTSTPGDAGQDALASKDLPIVDVPSSGASLDGNGVDLDRTMVAMAENALQYGASARAAGRKLAILRYVASDGS
jgi:flagellar basal-body rod protein FlgB